MVGWGGVGWGGGWGWGGGGVGGGGWGGWGDDHLPNVDQSLPAAFGISGANVYATCAGSHSLLHPTFEKTNTNKQTKKPNTHMLFLLGFV